MWVGHEEQAPEVTPSTPHVTLPYLDLGSPNANPNSPTKEPPKDFNVKAGRGQDGFPGQGRTLLFSWGNRLREGRPVARTQEPGGCSGYLRQGPLHRLLPPRRERTLLHDWSPCVQGICVQTHSTWWLEPNPPFRLVGGSPSTVGAGMRCSIS